MGPQHCLKTLGTNNPVMQCHMPEEEEELKALFPLRPCHVIHGVF